MQFVFIRDEEGVERIYVGDVCVGKFLMSNGATVWQYMHAGPPEATYEVVRDAIERADEAGFWAMRDVRSFQEIAEHLESGRDAWINDEVTVDVPVADNATLSVTTEDDES